MTHEFKVFMHRDLVDELDEGFSPMDGLVAIRQIFGELPRHHVEIASKRPRSQMGRSLRVYRGRYSWYPLGFSYVQIGKTLHVLQFWNDDESSRSTIDVVLSDEMSGIVSSDESDVDHPQKTYIVTVAVQTVDLYEVEAETPEDAMERWQDGKLISQPFSKINAQPVRAVEKGERQ